MRASMHWHYFQICQDKVKEYETIEAELKTFNRSASDPYDKEKELKIAKAYSIRERAVVIPIVFGAMCLEAFIYDYGADHISGKYMKDHLDKLNLPSKFVVVSKLVTGKQFPTDSQAYEGLVKLKEDRNSLVHFKSKHFSDQEVLEIESWHSGMNTKLRGAMYNAFNTVPKVMEELDILHEGLSNYKKSITDTKLWV